LPVGTGDRYLLVFWLHDHQRLVNLYENLS
jgi:hypothetical protein